MAKNGTVTEPMSTEILIMIKKIVNGMGPGLSSNREIHIYFALI